MSLDYSKSVYNTHYLCKIKIDDHIFTYGDLSPLDEDISEDDEICKCDSFC